MYSSKLSMEQNAALERFVCITGFPPIGIDDLDSGVITPEQLWAINQEFIFNIYATVQNINFPSS